jgi:cell wall-associated NlpC family hydrolase
MITPQQTYSNIANWLANLRMQGGQPQGGEAQSQIPGVQLGSPQPNLADGHEYDGLCEAYAEQQKHGVTGLYPSAIDCWNQSKNKVQGTAGIRPGDQVFFAPDKSNSGYGHTGIYEGNGQFKSATYNGVQTNDLNHWQQNTGQQLLGYTAE